jgi:hypothetical protein
MTFETTLLLVNLFAWAAHMTGKFEAVLDRQSDQRTSFKTARAIKGFRGFSFGLRSNSFGQPFNERGGWGRDYVHGSMTNDSNVVQKKVDSPI